jgi:hypothetical protein
MSRFFLPTTVCAAILLLGLSAQAEEITVNYEATMTALIGDFPAETLVSGTFTFDPDASPITQTTNQATYPALTHNATIGGTAFAGTSPTINLRDDICCVGSSVRDGYAASAQTTGIFDGNLAIQTFGLSYEHDAPSPNPALSGLDLPLSETDLSGFSDRRVFVSFTNTDEGKTYSVSGVITSAEFSDPTPTHECDGFYSPFDVAIGLTPKEQRVIPLKLQLYDADGIDLSPEDVSPPVVNVSYASNVNPNQDLSELIESASRADTGNQFRWDDTAAQWVFNLSTRPFKNAGTYTVKAMAGDGTYQIAPCIGTFVRQ